MKPFFVALALALAASSGTAQDRKGPDPGAHPGVDAKRVKRAIDRGIEFLKTSDSPGHNQSTDADELILLTFIHAGQEAQPRFKTLFDKMMADPLKDTYCVALQAIVDAHPELVVVQYQLASALMRAGRLDEAITVLQDARDRQPEEADLALALADALMRANRVEQAGRQADEAIALAKTADATTRAAAHELAVRIALARNDVEAATVQAKAAHDADPALPIEAFVRGRQLYDAGNYEEASAAFQEAATAAQKQKRTIPELHLYLGESLAHLERYSEAEAQYREELRTFPRSVQVYSRLAMLYAATNRQEAVEDVLNELVAATPTPESYAVAARLWTIVGNRSRAEALRSDARARFRGDPSLALLGKDGRR